MKLFSESTASLKEKKNENNVDPNYKGEDLPFLIAETITTAMEVDSLVHRINSEADEYVMEAAEERGVDLESESDERTSLIMEASFGEGNEDGILTKIWNFIKKMYNKVADFVKGILGRFQNVEKLLDKVISEYKVLETKMEDVTLPSSAELKFKKMEVDGGQKSVKALFNLEEIFGVEFKYNNKTTSYNDVQNLVTDAIADLTGESGNKLKLPKAQQLANDIQAINTELGGSNNENSQHKLLVKILNEQVMDFLPQAEKLDKNDLEQDPKQVVMDGTFLSETDELSGTEILDKAKEFMSAVDSLDPSTIRNMISDGEELFRKKADEFEKAASKLDKLVEKDSAKENVATDQVITQVTGALNNYSSVVGIYTAVVTNLYTFAVNYTQKYLNRAKGFAKDVSDVIEKEGNEK